MAVRKNVLQEDNILCELYVDTHSDVSDYSDNESLDTTGPMTPQFPHPFFLYQDNFYKCENNSDIARHKRESLQH
jgi:hypothetical protein